MLGLELRVQGLGFGVYGPGFGFRVHVLNLGYKVCFDEELSVYV